jgi:hypothetical protein
MVINKVWLISGQLDSPTGTNEITVFFTVDIVKIWKVKVVPYTSGKYEKLTSKTGEIL